MFVRLLLAAFVVIAQASRVGAMVLAPQPIEAPVPAKWRAPFAQFLTKFGVADVEATVEASRVGPYDEPWGGRPEMIVFRVIHPSACTADRDKCLTIVGHINQGKLVADLMFAAGGLATRGDVFDNVLGLSATPPILFFGRDSIVAVRNTAMGVVISEGPRQPDEPK